MPLNATTQLAGLLGWPVSHSLSPRLHNRWLAQLGIDGAYLPLPVRPGEVSRAIAGLEAAGFRGLNVTIPHKQEALAACHHLTPSAQAAGAINTLIFNDRQILGHNTDGEGFLRSLQAAGLNPAAPTLLLGAGGATRAIATALTAAGAEVHLAARRDEAAAALAAALHLHAIPWQHAPAALPSYGLLVNTTAGGMHSPLHFPLDAATPTLAVADIVYAPRNTPLLREARARNLATIEGIAMLLHQAALSFAAWFGTEPPIDAAITSYLLACES